MSRDINLLSEINKGLEKEEKLAKILKILCFASLIFVGLSSLVVFLLSRQVSIASVEEQQKAVLQKIEAMRKKETKLFVVTNRLKGISEILAKRVDYYKITNSILQKIPSGISVDKLTLGDKKISLMMSSDSLLSLGILISNLTDMVKKKEIITSLTLKSLSLNENAFKYSAAFEGDLKL